MNESVSTILTLSLITWTPYSVLDISLVVAGEVVGTA